MNLSLSRASAMRVAGATVMTAAALVAGLPAAAHAAPATTGDHDRHGDRSVSVTVENDTRDRLRLSPGDTDLTEGDWTQRPSRVIDPRRSGSFAAEGERRGGVEGTVTYGSTYGDVEITFNNSGRGRGDYDCEAPRRLQCEVDVDEDGREAELTVTVTRR